VNLTTSASFPNMNNSSNAEIFIIKI
jgi:hypothetical protein